MSDKIIQEAKELDPVDNSPKDQVDFDPSVEDPKHSDINEENPMPSPQQEEEIIKNKYGGLLPKKPPLISKDHERAFFDSADWALGKQGAQKSKGPLEALRPKLQPSPHQQVRSRRSAYAPAHYGEDAGNTNSNNSEDQSCTLDGSGNTNGNDSEDQSCTLDGSGNTNSNDSEDQSCTLVGSNNNSSHSEDGSCHSKLTDHEANPIQLMALPFEENTVDETL